MMMNRAFVMIALMILFLYFGVKGEIIKGVVVDGDSMPIGKVIVQIIDKGNPIYYATTSTEGLWQIMADSIARDLSLRFSKYGYDTVSVSLSSDSIYNAILFPKTKELAEVIIRAPHTRVKGDTIVYDVSALTSKTDRNIGDIIRKIPGVSIQEDIIYYDGEPINRFYIEGLNMLGGDYAIATNNINPEDVSSVSIYERHQPKKVLKDLKMSDKAALNLKLKKKSMLRPIGYMEGGIGANSDTDIRYEGNLYGLLVSSGNQTMISAKINNDGELYLLSKEKDIFTTSGSSVMEKLPLGNSDIPDKRYYNNRTKNVEGNTLFKFNNDVIFSFRAMYGHEDDKYSNASMRRYLASGEEDIIYREEGITSLCSSHLGATAKIERNSSKNYLLDQIGFDGIGSNNSYKIGKEFGGVEMLENKEISFTNQFNTIIREGGNLLEISSDISYADMPHYKMHYSDDSDKDKNLKQILSGSRFAGNIKGGYGYVFSNIVIGGEVSFQFENDSFKSVESFSELTTNNKRGYNLTSALRPYIEWKISKMRWRTELETSYRVIKYKSADDKRLFRHNKPYIDGSTNLFWKVSPYFHMDAAFSVKHVFGGIKDFIESPIYSSYRTRITLGNGELSKARSLRYSLNMTYTNPLHGLVCRGMAAYTETSKNSMASSVINPDGDMLISNAMEANNGKSILWNFDISKRLTGFDAVFKFLINGLSTHNRRFRQQKPVQVLTNGVNIDVVGVANLLSDLLSLDVDCGYSFSKQNIKTLGTKSHISNFRENFKLSWFILPYLELYGGINARQSRMENGTYTNYLFVDGGCRFKKSKYEIELVGKNLANYRKYEYTMMNPLEIDTYSYSLRPMEFILTFKWIF